MAARVYQRAALRPGMLIEGPAIIEDVATTVVTPPRARCLVGEDLSLRLDLRDRIAGARPKRTRRTGNRR